MFEAFFEDVLLRAPPRWLGIKLDAATIAKLVPLLSELAAVQHTLWRCGETWHGLDRSSAQDTFDEALRKGSFASIGELPAVALQFIAPIKSDDVWASLANLEETTRTSFDVDSRDHVLSSTFYGLTLLWVWLSKALVRSVAYDVDKLSVESLLRVAAAQQRTVVDGLQRAIFVRGVVEADNGDGTFAVRYDDGSIEPSTNDFDVIRNVSFGDDQVVQVGQSVRSHSRSHVDESVRRDVQGSRLTERWLDEVLGALKRGLGPGEAASPLSEDLPSLSNIESGAFADKFKAKFSFSPSAVANAWLAYGEHESWSEASYPPGDESWSEASDRLKDLKMLPGRLQTFYEHGAVLTDTLGDEPEEHQFGNLQMATVLCEAMYALGSRGDWLPTYLAPLRDGVSRLRRLSLACCCILDDGAQTVADILAQQRTPIDVLDLRVNYIGDEGLGALSRAINTGIPLCELNLEGNVITNAGVEVLVDAILQAKPKLKRVLLCDMRPPEYAAYARIHGRADVGLFDVLPASAGRLSEDFRFECRPRFVRKPPPDAVFQDLGRTSILPVDVAALAAYYERLDQASGLNTAVKLLFVGLGTAGKTSLSNRLRGVLDTSTQSFCTALENRTVGIDISQWRPTPGVTFSIWDLAGQDAYGLSHQFFLSEFSLNVIVVDVNRYALDDTVDGRIDVVAYEIMQTLGIDVRAALPHIKEPVLESDRIYREAWTAACDAEKDIACVQKLLGVENAQVFAVGDQKELLTEAEASSRRLLSCRDPLIQRQTDVEMLLAEAAECQRHLKRQLATRDDDAWIDAKGRTTRDTTSFACPAIAAVYDPGVKSRSRVEEKARFKYDGCFARVRDVSRLAIQCDTVVDLLVAAQFVSTVFRVASFENRFAKPTPLGWRDLQFLVVLLDGHIAEIQIQLVRFAIARDTAHSYYKTLRSRLRELFPTSVDSVANTLLDRLANSVSGADIFDREIQSWIDILQNRTAASTGAKFLVVASKIDLCPDFAAKAAAMEERIRSAEFERLAAINREICALEADEKRFKVKARVFKTSRLASRQARFKAGALDRVSKKRKREFQRLLKTRPVMLNDRIYCVSAQTGAGIDELEAACVEAANPGNFPFFGEELPESDLKLADAVENIRHDEPVLTWDAYAALAQKCGVPDKHVKNVATGLQRRGKILHFPNDDTSLANLVFTDCQWIVDVLKCVIRHDLVLDDDDAMQRLATTGIITRPTLHALWRSAGFDIDLLPALEGLLVRFELVVPFDHDRSAFLCPAYLPSDVPETASLRWDRAGPRHGHISTGGLRIEFPFAPPRGFFERYVIRLRRLLAPHNNDADVVCWKGGLLKLEDPWLRIDLTDRSKVAHIDVESRHALTEDADAASRSLALTSAWAVSNTAKYCAAELLAEWPGIIFALKVVCPSCVARDVPSPATWAIEDFVHADPASTIHCEVCGADVPLDVCVPPLELVLKDVKRLKRIAAKWKNYRR